MIRRKVLRPLLLLTLVGSVTILTGCRDTPTADSNQTMVGVDAELASTTVASSSGQKSGIVADGGTACDSLAITNVRILISRLKLHRDRDEDNCECGNDVKTGPFVLEIGPRGPRGIKFVSMPPGHYRKAKLEFHRFASSELGRYLTDSLFRDFATDERATVVIRGVVYIDGKAMPFEFHSDVTANINIDFDNEVICNAGERNTLVIVLDAGKIFKHKGLRLVRDPRDGRNKKEIDGEINSCFRMSKRS